MKKLTKIVLAGAAVALVGMAAAVAQEREAFRVFGNDLFAAGSNVRISQAGLEDVFAAGQTVVLAAPITESAHMAGRDVRVEQAVGKDFYGAGSNVEVRAPVAGDVTAAGADIEIAGSVGDDLLLAGNDLEVSGPVAGNASLAGESVTISGVITGSVEIRADRITFGPGARIDGTLAYWSDATVTIPGSVISPDRVTGKLVKKRERKEESFADEVWEKAHGLGILLVLGVIFAALVPVGLARAHEGLRARPWLHLLYGFVATAALLGSFLLLLVSVIGIPLALVMALVVPLALLAGYLTAAYVIGSLLLGLVRVRLAQERLAAIAAVVVGLVVLALIKLIPVLGWSIAVVAVVMSLGAWFVMFARPRAAELDG